MSTALYFWLWPYICRNFHELHCSPITLNFLIVSPRNHGASDNRSRQRKVEMIMGSGLGWEEKVPYQMMSWGLVRENWGNGRNREVHLEASPIDLPNWRLNWWADYLGLFGPGEKLTFISYTCYERSILSSHSLAKLLASKPQETSPTSFPFCASTFPFCPHHHTSLKILQFTC